MACADFDVELARDADLQWCLGPPLHWCLTTLGVTDEQLGDAIVVFETRTPNGWACVAPMPGAEIVISELHDAGIDVGIVTIKPQKIALNVLEVIGLRDVVDALHGRADDLDPRTKTDLLREAWGELEGDAPLYTGDHDNDELAATELGIPFLRYPEHSWLDIRAAVLK